jgi:predicted AlkP superfamily pyrophosphatase or phosphodiesterase
LPKRILAALLLAITACMLLVTRSRSRGAPDETPRRPRLIVVIVIDQFPYDYLTRFRPYFVARGFNLLLSGADFINCRYDDATTATGPGHACLFTGAYPNIHGIVGNEWYDRSLGRAVNCVEDSGTKLVETAEGPSQTRGASPHFLLGSTWGDELRFASNFQSKVISVSLKDRGAILPGGHTANAAYWYDSATGRFVTSTYYVSALPAWVAKFNDQSPAREYCGKPWQALPETPGGGGRVLGQFKSAAGEPCPDRRFLFWLRNVPFVSKMQLDFARAAIQEERLGQGPATDLLAISLSVNDSVGHEFGPYSPEVADTVLRTDRDLARFFEDLDRTVGLSNVWIALSADHGVAPNPHFIKEHHLGMGNFRLASLSQAVEGSLSQALGQGRWIQSLQPPFIYLNQATIREHNVTPERAAAEAAKAAMSVDGVKAAFTRNQLLTGSMDGSPLARKAANSFEAQRGGDVFVILDPYAVPVSGEMETTHGSPWAYDAQVPLLLWGSAFKPGMYAVPCQPIDLAATLAAALGLNQPSGVEGRPLTPALKAR